MVVFSWNFKIRFDISLRFVNSQAVFPLHRTSSQFFTWLQYQMFPQWPSSFGDCMLGSVTHFRNFALYTLILTKLFTQQRFLLLNYTDSVFRTLRYTLCTEIRKNHQKNIKSFSLNHSTLITVMLDGEIERIGFTMYEIRTRRPNIEFRLQQVNTLRYAMSAFSIVSFVTSSNLFSGIFIGM